MASTLLAVDDSVTMRKVLEITFAGPDFRVVTANSPDAALQKLKTDKPDLVIADITLEPKNGYELCKAIKQLSPTTPVLLLSSKQNPFDAAKGSGAQADEHMDKPFDTQQMIDKVKKLLSTPIVAKPAAAPPPATAAQTSPSMQNPIAAQPAAAAAAAPAAAPARAPGPPGAAAPATATPQRAKTLIYNPPTGAVPGRPTGPLAPTPVTGLPQQQRAPVAALAPEPAPAPAAAAARSHTPAPVQAVAAAAPVVAAAPAAAAAVHVNGQMAAKLEQIGLSPAQVDAVLALSREVVERVVWEVVPVLAETIIKEEIARLTK